MGAAPADFPGRGGPFDACDRGWFIAERGHERFGARPADEEEGAAAMVQARGVATINGEDMFM
eukprot:10031186-Lingulodinium_polyedra.AAC.1